MGDKLRGMLGAYRVLDLTGEEGLLCGKLLGDLGADVIKIEKPGGDPARHLGPFYHDEPNPEKSLFWFAFNTSKRGITLDIQNRDGQETFKKLVRTADFVIESFSPGYMDSLGLGYSAMEKLNPAIIMVSITPFGQTGPYQGFRASDVVIWAMGGFMHGVGHTDGRPLRISHPCQAYLHAAAEAAGAAMVALNFRQKTGQGQWVDVSIQECVARLTAFFNTCTWDMVKLIPLRGVQGPTENRLRVTRFWQCKDGLISFHCFGGLGAKERNLPLIRWMESEGITDVFLRGFDWDNFEYSTTTQETIDRLEAPIRRFFLSRSKWEIMDGAIKNRVMLCPVATTADVTKSSQLEARNFWAKLQHPELGASVTYCGAFARASETPVVVSRCAPRIGEHNREVLGELESVNKQSVSGKESLNGWNPGRNQGALTGLKVVDFTWSWAGPIATKTLADHGAEVIKIESTERPDILRTLPPYKNAVVGLNRGMFNQDNTGKLSLTLNLAHPKGAEIAEKLVARADLVVENSAAGSFARMGLGYDQLKKVKPDIIILSSCMMGQTGPWASHRGFGYLTTAVSGFSHIAGWVDQECAYLESYTDFIGPHLIVLLVLAALDYRQRTGKGQYIDLSQYENAVQFMEPLILDQRVNARTAERMGNWHHQAVPHGAYRCLGEDRWCSIAVFTDEDWQKFSQVIGNPDWTKDPRFSTFSARKQFECELDMLVEKWTVNHSAEEVMTVMQAAGVAAGVLETGEDLLERDPQLKHRRYFRALDHPEIGKHYVPRPSFILSKSPCELSRAPLLGEHNEHVLKNILNIPDEEITELIIGGVIQ